MNQGNTKLVNSGVQNEESDLRAHVCPLAKAVYVFPTHHGATIAQDCIDGRLDYYLMTIRTDKIVTAEGYLVPWRDIPQIVEIKVKNEVWEYLDFVQDLSTSQKGRRAEVLVKRMIKENMLPFHLFQIDIDSTEVKDVESQIRGADIVINIAKKAVVQVKCDFRGGNGKQEKPGSTGNLFLQVRECNPNKQY